MAASFVDEAASSAIGASQMLAKNNDGATLSVDMGGSGVFISAGVLKVYTVSVNSIGLQVISTQSGRRLGNVLKPWSMPSIAGPLYFSDLTSHDAICYYHRQNIVMEWEISVSGQGVVNALCQVEQLSDIPGIESTHALDIALTARGPLMCRQNADVTTAIG